MEPTVLTTTATIHQTKGVAPEQLERFMECLIETLSKDYQVSGIEVEAWKNVCGPGVKYLKLKMSPAKACDLGVMGVADCRLSATTHFFYDNRLRQGESSPYSGRVVFDIDSGEGVEFTAVCEVSLRLKEVSGMFY